MYQSYVYFHLIFSFLEFLILIRRAIRRVLCYQKLQTPLVSLQKKTIQNILHIPPPPHLFYFQKYIYIYTRNNDLILKVQNQFPFFDNIFRFSPTRHPCSVLSGSACFLLNCMDEEEFEIKFYAHIIEQCILI